VKRSSSGRNKAGEAIGAFNCWRQNVATWTSVDQIGGADLVHLEWLNEIEGHAAGH